VQYSDAVDSFTYHRSWSHSIFVLSAISPLVAIVINKLAPNIPYRRCLLLVWLCLFTHPILDGFTIYGTQIFWPSFVYRAVDCCGCVGVATPAATAFSRDSHRFVH